MKLFGNASWNHFRNLLRGSGNFPTWRLVLLLAVSCLTLFIFFIVPSSVYKNMQPLLGERQSKKEEVKNTKSIEMTEIPVLVLGMEADAASPQKTDTSGTP